MELNLVEGRPVLRVEFHLSLAVSLLDVAGLVLKAPEVEGLDRWIYDTFNSLPPTLERDMRTILPLLHTGDPGWLFSLPLDHPAHTNWEALVGWIDQLDESDFRELIDGALDCFAQHRDPPSLDDRDELESCLGVKFGKEQLDQVIQLVRNPLELKVGLISVITRFWEQFFRQEYRQCLVLMERSVATHRRREYGVEFPAVYAAVAGRRLPLDLEMVEELERVIFVPSCHIGPYGIFIPLERERPTMVVHYNCRLTGAPEREEVPPIQSLFPPLKGLADETRLQILSILDGRELYAQEIVDRLDISQSAVSRHLKLMISAGLLTVRRQESMKYYTINEETLTVLAEQLTSFRGGVE